jgi:peptidoglycan/LPS O-acetylase OafA/YrhL
LNRNQTLDVIRGFLSWAVVAVHVAFLTGIAYNIQHNVGIWAVEGFIVLSGFVITQLLVTKREPYAKFIFRRFMRLFPAFAACLALALLVRPFTLGTMIPTPYQIKLDASENHFFWWHLATHVILIHGLIPANWLPLSSLAFLPPAWSISLEFQLYLIAPFAVWWIVRFGFKGLAFLVLVSALIFVPQIQQKIDHIWTPTGAFLPQKLFFFLAGMTMYFLFQGRGKRIRYWPILVHLGNVSYSTYLVHWPVLAYLNIFLPSAWSRMERAEALLAMGAPITLLCSLLLYRFVEQPGIALGRHLLRPKNEVNIDSSRRNGPNSAGLKTFQNQLSTICKTAPDPTQDDGNKPVLDSGVNSGQQEGVVRLG